MPNYSFGLVIDASPEQVDTHIDALFEAGCDDATISEIDGILFAEFNREAGTFRDALTSAIADVEKVLPVRHINTDTPVDDEAFVAAVNATLELRAAIKQRRNDHDFTARLKAIIARERAVLDLLAN